MQSFSITDRRGAAWSPCPAAILLALAFAGSSIAAAQDAMPSGVPGGRRAWNRAPTRATGMDRRPEAEDPDSQPPKEFRDDAKAEQPSDDGAQPDSPLSESDQAALLEAGELLAEVGNLHVFAADALPTVRQIVEQEKLEEKMAKGQMTPEEYKAIRRMILEQVARGQIEAKILYCEFRRNLTKAPEDKRPKVADIMKKTDDNFDRILGEERKKVEQVPKHEIEDYIRESRNGIIGRLAVTMKMNNLWTYAELDEYLRKYGSSIRKQKNLFHEFILGQSVLQQNMNFKPEISHDEMLGYYEKNITKYDFPARVRFEAMMVKFDKFASREEAEQAIRAMGDEVYYGAAFDAVARRASQGMNSEEGGQYGWTTAGTLASKPVEEAVFNIPPGRLSKVIEDDRGLTIVRVLEREEAGRKSFADVQSEIREALRREKIRDSYEKYLSKVREQTRVWTVFDDAARTAKENLAARDRLRKSRPR